MFVLFTSSAAGNNALVYVMWPFIRSAPIAELVEHWIPVVASRVRDASTLDIYETPDGDGLRSVAAAAASRS